MTRTTQAAAMLAVTPATNAMHVIRQNTALIWLSGGTATLERSNMMRPPFASWLPCKRRLDAAARSGTHSSHPAGKQQCRGGARAFMQQAYSFRGRKKNSHRPGMPPQIGRATV